MARQVKFEVRWVRTTLKEENFNYRHSERTAPVTQGETLYGGNGLDSFVAVKKTSGRILWRKSLAHGLESGSAIEGNMIYFGASDGQFYGLNREDGKVVWTFPTRVETLATPLVDNGIVYFLSGNNIVYALDGKTGKQLWFYNRGEASSLSIRGGSRPTLYKGTLYVGFSDGFLGALNAKDGSLVWERKLNSNMKFVDVDATPVVDEANIWVSSFDGALYCLSRTDGQIQWRLEDGGATQVTIEGNKLYYSSNSQNVYALEKKTGVQIWKYSYDDKLGVPTQPLLYRGLVLFGQSDGDLIALSELTGVPLAQYEPGTGVFATPLIDRENGWVYISSNQANIHALKLIWHRAQDDYQWPRDL
jgi:outer membrane protein assembly factor BamB